jgi:eukaryotic-like serine/threonine-protein kinase
MATGALPFSGESSAVIFKAILDSVPPSPIRFNREVPPKLEDIIYKALEKDRNLRYQGAAEIRADLQRLKRDMDTGRAVPAGSGQVAAAQAWDSHLSGARPMPVESGVAAAASASRSGPHAAAAASGSAVAPSLASSPGIGVPGAVAVRKSRLPIAAAGAVVAVLIVAVAFYFRSRPVSALTEKDTLVLADFANTTDDPVFDGTLKQALAVDLEQSPFLRVVPPSQIQQTLRFMGRQGNERLTSDLARDLCQRVGSKAMLSGSIASLGISALTGKFNLFFGYF